MKSVCPFFLYYRFPFIISGYSDFLRATTTTMARIEVIFKKKVHKVIDKLYLVCYTFNILIKGVIVMSEQLQVINGTFFAVVLYPDEDFKHQQFLNYVSMKPEYQICYISHLPEGEDKKPHVHALIHTKNRMRATSFVKFFDPWINYAECIHSPDSYIRYMLHDTPSSIMEGKTPYSLADLRGDKKLWKNLEQNSNFVQLREFFMYMHDGDTLLDIIKRIEDSGVDPSPYVDYLHSNSFLAVSICNQEINKYYKELQYLKSEVFN